MSTHFHHYVAGKLASEVCTEQTKTFLPYISQTLYSSLHINKMKAIHLLNSHTDNEISLVSPVSQLNCKCNHTQNHVGICIAVHLLNQITLINIKTLSIQQILVFDIPANLNHPLLPLL